MTVEERLDRIEQALAAIQHEVGYFGLCVNQQMHPDLRHPHWDDAE